MSYTYFIENKWFTEGFGDYCQNAKSPAAVTAGPLVSVSIIGGWMEGSAKYFGDFMLWNQGDRRDFRARGLTAA